ncbi:MAG TPA: restriction endonuclease [Candidatus Saccharimonadales bacterium]|nr:restriction endonuclease [Candidatus Saccharimonadales bacterium]
MKRFIPTTRRRFGNYQIAASLLVLLVVALASFQFKGSLLPFLFVTTFLAGCVLLLFIARGLYHKKKALQALAQSDITTMSGQAFEQYMAALFKSQGFNTKITPTTGDFGVDLIIRKNGESTAVQLKRYRRPVSLKAVQEAVTGKRHYRCNKAMVVTNSVFTASAKSLAQSNDCELIDKSVLAEWVLAFRQPKHTKNPEPKAPGQSVSRARKVLSELFGVAS